MNIIDVLVLIILFLTNTLQAITGFAGTLLAMPPTIKLIGAEEAKVLLTVIAEISCFMIVLTGIKEVDWKESFKMICLMLVGMIAGMKIYEVMPLNILLTAYGILIILIAIVKLHGEKSFDFPNYIYLIIVLIAGIVHGMFASGGALLVVYAVKKIKKKEKFRVTMAFIWFVLDLFITASQAQKGYISPHVINLIIIGVIPVFIGTMIGDKLVKKMNQQVFMKITYILLIISGVLAIV